MIPNTDKEQGQETDKTKDSGTTRYKNTKQETRIGTQELAQKPKSKQAHNDTGAHGSEHRHAGTQTSQDTREEQERRERACST
jgi:hypothetical protein